MRAFILFLALAGCTNLTQSGQIGSLAEGDLKSAAAVATATGDLQGAACWTALEGIVPAAGSQVGIATEYQIFRSGSIEASGSCSSVFSGLALHLLSKLPFTP